MEKPTRYNTVDESAPGNERENQRHITQALNVLLDGGANNHYIVELTPDMTTTTIEALTSRPGAVALLVPRSASAAAELGTTWSETLGGSILIHHLADPASGREFGVVLCG